MWFKARELGWGWTPVTLEGWVVVGIFVILVVASAIYFAYQARTGVTAGTALLRFVLMLVLLTVAMFVIAWIKGDPAGWHWGA